MQQHTGMPFIIMQQVQPAAIIFIMASQQAWIMAQQSSSPLVQVIIMPSLVISHLHMPMTMLHSIMTMPFIIIAQEHMPAPVIMQRFCIMAHWVLSSQQQVIFIPPLHFSIFMVQRGIIISDGMFIMGIEPIGMLPPIMPISLIRPAVNGFSSQKPTRRALEQDQAAVARAVAKSFPRNHLRIYEKHDK